MKKRITAFGLSAVMILGILSAQADELSDLQDEAAYSQAQIEALNGSIDNLQAEKAIVLGQIDVADQELVLTIATISTLNEQIAVKNTEIAETTVALQDAEERESTEYEAMKTRIQYLYEVGGDAGWATVLLNESNLSDMLTQAEYTEKIYEYDRACLQEYADTVTEVSTLKSQYETEAAELQLMLVNQQEQQAYLEQLVANLQASSDNYDVQLANATAAAASYAELLSQQNMMIDQLIAEREAARIAAEAAAAAAAAAAAQAAAEAEAAAAAAAAEAAAAGYDYEAAYQEAINNTYVEPDPVYYEDVYYDAGTGNAVVDRAYSWLGRADYVWGACSPGAFDCSGFVSYCLTGAYARLGTTYTFLTWPQVSNPMPGDVCVNAQHCGIYIGDGMMIDASDYGVGVIMSSVRPGMIYVRY